MSDAGLLALDDVTHTAVTPAGLRRLAGLPGLRKIWAGGILIAEQQARDLQALMPNVSVSR